MYLSKRIWLLSVSLLISVSGVAVDQSVPLRTNGVNFGGMAIGTIGSAKSVALKNSGKATLNNSSITAPTAPFLETSTCTSSLAPGKSCKISQQLGGKTEAQPPNAGRQQILAGYGRLPLSFEVNRGQADDPVKFLSRGPGYSLFLTPTEAVLTLSQPLTDPTPSAKEPVALRKFISHALRIKLVGANPAPSVSGLEELANKSNYFIGNDPKKWQTDVPNYAKVRYLSVYPGVDLAYYGNQRRLEHDFIVSPGADPRAITLGFDSKEKLRIDEHGNLVMRNRMGEVRLEKPLIYQDTGTIRQRVAGGYVLKGHDQVGFRVGRYDGTKSLVIDPVLSYSTLVNSTFAANEYGTAIAVDSAGSAYVTGKTDSGTFPTTTGAFATTSTYGLVKAFVMKLNADGSGLVYSTYLGGTGGDYGQAIAIDSSGEAYLTGTSNSADFPVTAGAFQTSLSGAGFKPFVAKLNATGSALVYSTYLGGTSGDNGYGIAVDSTGSAYVVGHTGSSNFPVTAGALRTTNSWPSGFVTKLSVDGASLVYSTYLGSNSYNDNCNAVAVDSAGFAYVTGSTYTYPNNTPSNFPVTTGAFQTGTPAESPTGFVTKMNANGSGLIYSTFLGGYGALSPRGIGGESGQSIALDSAGSAYVTGTTYSPDFPTTTGAFQTAFSGAGADFFATKLNPAGSAPIYSTFLGGTTFARNNAWDPPSSIALDSAGSAYVSGTTNSASFPTTSDAFQSTLAGATDAFVVKLSADGSGLLYSTYLGGTNYELGLGIAVDSVNSVYVTGSTNSSNFPTTPGAFRTTPGSANGTGFVAKFASLQVPTTTALSSLLNPAPFGQSVVLTATVTPAIPVTATGTVTFYDGTASLGSSTLSGTQAQLSTSALSAGTHSLTASYGGDSNDAGSTSAALTQTVNQATSTLNWTAPAAITYGTSLSATQLNATASVSGTFVYSPATGTVLSVGTNTLNVTFTPTDSINYTPASASVSISVTQASSTVGLSSSTNPSGASQSVTFTAAITSQLGGTTTGTVTFNDGATALGTAPVNANSAALTTSTLAAGSHSITASYSGDTNNASSTSTALTQAVNKVTPTINWPAPAAIIYGSPLGGKQLNATASVSGTFVYSPASGTVLGVGTSTLNVSFTPTDSVNYNTAAASVSIAVTQASSIVNLASNPNPSSPNQAVTLTATITAQNGGTATGTLTFADNVAGNLGTASIAGNVATLSTTALTAGSHSITATYSGDSNVLGNTSATLTQTVGGTQLSTITTLVSSINPSYVTQPVIFTAAVMASNGTPATGIVTFKQGNSTVATASLVAGVAAYSVAFPTAGSRTLTAVYAASGIYLASSSTALTQRVRSLPAATTTVVASSASPTLVGQAVILNAAVASSFGPIPDGETVTFLDGGGARLGTGTTSGGAATLSYSGLTAGSHPIRASYVGDATFAASMSPAITQVVNRYATATTLASNLNPATFGQGVTFTAIVTSTGPIIPTSTLTFMNGSSNLGRVTLNASGVATLTSARLTAGSHSITALYNGDSQSATSSDTLSQVVNPAVTATVLTSSRNPSTFGRSVTFTVTVTSPTATPTGTVTFASGLITLATVTLGGGSATFSTTALPRGANPITATYNGTTNLTGSSTSLIQQVN